MRGWPVALGVAAIVLWARSRQSGGDHFPMPGPQSAPFPHATRGGQTYTVESGDTLSRIARRVYGNGARWRVIYEANRAMLTSPDHIQVGQVLVIPGSGR